MNVLLVGYRPPIAQRLNQRGIPFTVWHDRPIKKRTIVGCTRVIDDHPFATSVAKIKQQLASLFPAQARFSHVIGGTESSVVTASVARRTFGSRESKDTVVLRCHNKRMMKEFLRDRGFPLIPFIYAARKNNQSPLTTGKVIEQLGLPVVIKPLGTSGGRGMVMAHQAEQIEPYLNKKVLFEKFVDAPEVSVETLIVDGDALLNNMTQYVKKRSVNLVPCGHDGATQNRVLELHREILQTLKIKWGLTHAEYYLADDQIYFGEIALRPPGGYIMDLISLAYDFNLWHAFVDNELGLLPVLKQEPSCWAASVLIHPGEGTIASIWGAEAIRSSAECQKLHLHCRPGQTLGPRGGVSEVAAFGIFAAQEKVAVLAAVKKCEELLVFEMT